MKGANILGFLAIQKRNLSSALNAKALIGIGNEGRNNGRNNKNRSGMGCG